MDKELIDLLENPIDCPNKYLYKMNIIKKETKKEIQKYNKAVRYAMGSLWYYTVMEPIADNNFEQ